MATYDIDHLPSKFFAGDIINCPYSGGEKSIVLPKGQYKLECWGARGEFTRKTAYYDDPTFENNFGGYSYGNYINNNKTIKLFLNCGGAGGQDLDEEFGGSYNGGGGYATSWHNYGGGFSGGGATHIATRSGILSSLEEYKSTVIIVAGGSGGMGLCNGFYPDEEAGLKGGIGGGTSGGDGISFHNKYSSYRGFGGTYTSGGVKASESGSSATDGSFGQGGKCHTKDPAFGYNTSYGGAGGAGWYGGGGGYGRYSGGTHRAGSGGAGSGYVADATYAVGQIYLTNADTVQETISTNPDTINYAGYIRITVIEASYPKLVGTVYCGEAIIAEVLDVDVVNITYNGQIKAIVSEGQKKIIKTGGKFTQHNIGIGNKTLQCQNKAMLGDVYVYGLQNGLILEHEGDTPGKSTYDGSCITPLIRLPNGCRRITINTQQTAVGYDCLHEYDARGNYISYWQATENPRTFDLDGAGATDYIQCSFNVEKLAQCSIYDETNHKWIWKPKSIS